MFKMTKWTKAITDSGKDEIIAEKPEGFECRFRLLDDDGVIYGYGYSDSDDGESAFEPLDKYCNILGCTEIQYKNLLSGKYETL